MKFRTNKIDRPQFIGMMVAAALLIGSFVAFNMWIRGVTVYETAGEIFLGTILVGAGGTISLLPMFLFHYFQKRRRKHARRA
jgi:hypothetical protein